MRLLSYRKSDGTERWGAVIDDHVVDLSAQHGHSLHACLAADGIAAAMATAASATPDARLDEVSCLPPIRTPEKIACIGVNYANRNAEYKDGSEPPKYPSLFMRTPDSLTGHKDALLRPPESDQLDYEGEIGVVIGRGGRRIQEADAFSHIAGLTVINEGTIRDWLRHSKFNVTQGKNFYHSGAIGPWMVTADEFSEAQLRDMRVQTHVNGELRQDDTTANMMFPICYQIAYMSQFYTFKPGDIIATGTPNGAGARFDPPRYLVPGDEVTVTVAGVGTLSNPVRDEIIA